MALWAESRSKNPTDEATDLASALPGRRKGVRYPLRKVSPVPEMRRAQPGLGSIGLVVLSEGGRTVGQRGEAILPAWPWGWGHPSQPLIVAAFVAESIKAFHIHTVLHNHFNPRLAPSLAAPST